MSSKTQRSVCVSNIVHTEPQNMTKEVKNVKKKKNLPREVLISNDVSDKIDFEASCVDYVHVGDSLELHL